MCFIGEWYGDTGDLASMHLLQSEYHLVKRAPLPNWSDTAHELTIWERRGLGECFVFTAEGICLWI